MNTTTTSSTLTSQEVSSVNPGKPAHDWISWHARKRMQQRAISPEMVQRVLQFGRMVYAKGATYHVVGSREVEDARSQGVDLQCCEGIHVVQSRNGYIKTVYRNRKVLAIRPRKRMSRRRFRQDWDSSKGNRRLSDSELMLSLQDDIDAL